MPDTSPHFASLTTETAPPAARPYLERMQAQLGFVPRAMARQAVAPLSLEGFAVMHALFERSALAPVEREVVTMVVARVFDCALCRGFHAKILGDMGAPPALVEALLAGQAPADPRLAGLAAFTEAVLRDHGGVDDATLDAFVGLGFTPAQALDVVVGVATYTLSTFANRMTRSHTLR